jgi:DNA-3-methyladenine glycosylase II
MPLLPIAVVQPFPWAALLEYLSFRLISDIESVENGQYVRRIEGGSINVSFDERTAQLVAVTNAVVDESEMHSRVVRLFDARFDSKLIQTSLCESRLLAPLVAKVPGMRPLGAWDAFELCVRTILGQQVTVAAARTLMRRWVQRCGAITPECLLAADLTNMGMPGKRVETIRALALAVQQDRVRFDRPWAEIDAALQTLPGFGPWTRAYLAIRLGREPDAFPASDLGLIRAAKVSSPAELLKVAEHWRPYRGYAATYLWAVAN